MSNLESEGTVLGRALSRDAAPTRGAGRPAGLGGDWWRHLVAIVAIVAALFPVAYVVAAALNPVSALGAARLIPQELTLDNFRTLFDDPDIAYARWYVNSLVVASLTAIFTVVLGALTAYAFSRFRFRGRYTGMLGLLLIQMFPQFLALVAIYLIMLRISGVFPRIGLNTEAGLILVYLGGALGVNAWLLKGFLDTIPRELDESARVDGASAGQIFWGIVLPLATPVLAVVGLLSFILTINEFVLASVILESQDKLTLPPGMYTFIDQQYSEKWGPFAAGVVLAAVPAIVLFQFLQRYIVHGLTRGAVKG